MKRSSWTAFSLDELTNITDGVLLIADSIKRPFTQHEKSTYRWILSAWESGHVREECRNLPNKKMSDYSFRIVRLRMMIVADPVLQKARIKRSLENLAAKANDGNNKTKIDAMEGVTDRGLTDKEAIERLVLLRSMVKSIRYVARELALHHGSRRAIANGINLKKLFRESARVVHQIESNCNILEKPKEPANA